MRILQIKCSKDDLDIYFLEYLNEASGIINKQLKKPFFPWNKWKVIVIFNNEQNMQTFKRGISHCCTRWHMSMKELPVWK